MRECLVDEIWKDILDSRKIIGGYMQKGQRVRMAPMWKYDEAFGVIHQIKADGYVVVIWDGINGEWHYTPEQAKKLEIQCIN